MKNIRFEKNTFVFSKVRRRAILATLLSPFLALRELQASLPQGNTTQEADALSDYLRYDKNQYISAAQKIEDGRIGMVAGGISGTYLKFSDNFMNVTSSEEQNKRVRVVPMINNGSIQTLSDLMYLKATDLGILQADVMQNVRELKDCGHREAGIMLNHLRFITKLYDEEVHLLAKGFNSIEELTNTTINVGALGSGTQFTAERILDKLVPAVGSKTYFTPDRALDELRNGRIHAMFLVVGQPSPLFNKFQKDESLWKNSDLNFLPLKGNIGSEYSKAKLSKDRYSFIDKDVQTISVPSVLAAYNHTSENRKRNLERFCAAFLDNLDELQQHSGENQLYHQKWIEFFKKKNLTADVPAWTRLEAMEKLIG